MILLYVLLLAFYNLCSFCDEIPKYSCPNSNKVNKNDWHWRGTNLGGWLVLEPWITPSLFYQFLGAEEKWGADAPNKVALDTYTFCTALGTEEANKQLRRHWKTWVTEEQIFNLARTGIDTIRIPVGDWMFVTYEPYTGCFDGALEELNRVIEICRQYKLNVFFDIHALKGSQNPFDNSGHVSIQWQTFKNFDVIRTANWIGDYDYITQQTIVNYAHINHSISVVERIVGLYKNDPIIVGIEAVNEPWFMTPIEPLKDYYWQVYQIVQKAAPHWVSVFHDSFRPWAWKGFLANCSNFAFDSHIYEAWENPMEEWRYAYATCVRHPYLSMIEDSGMPLIVGEWSLATDNCAMWLNGYQNNVPGYPKKKCDWMRCPDPYMGPGQPGAPPDVSIGVQDPIGSGGWSSVSFGMCPIDAVPEGGDEVIKLYADAQLQVFEKLHGQFFWNFRTELSPRWSFQESVKRGWLPTSWTSELLFSLSTCEIVEDLHSTSIDGPKNDQTKFTEKNIPILIGTSLVFLGVVGAVLYIFRAKNKTTNLNKYVVIDDKSSEGASELALSHSQYRHDNYMPSQISGNPKLESSGYQTSF